MRMKFIKCGPWIIRVDAITGVFKATDRITVYVPGITKEISTTNKEEIRKILEQVESTPAE